MKMTDIAMAQLRAREMQAAPKPGVKLDCGFETAIEPNAAARARIAGEIEAAKAAGIIPPEGFDLTPEEQDVVVYKCITVTSATTPGGLAIPGGQLAMARLRGEEFMRMPLVYVRDRSDAKFREMFGG